MTTINTAPAKGTTPEPKCDTPPNWVHRMVRLLTRRAWQTELDRAEAGYQCYVRNSTNERAAIAKEIRETWNAARDAGGQLEAFRILERMTDRLGYGRTQNNPPLLPNVQPHPVGRHGTSGPGKPL